MIRFLNDVDLPLAYPIDSRLPLCSVIRPTSTSKAGAVAALAALTGSGLFTGQSSAFLNMMNLLAHLADTAHR